VPDGPQVTQELTIPDVPDFYSALTNHTGCRRPLAHPPVGRAGVCYFLDAGHTATGRGGLSTGGGGIGLGGSSMGGRCGSWRIGGLPIGFGLPGCPPIRELHIDTPWNVDPRVPPERQPKPTCGGSLHCAKFTSRSDQKAQLNLGLCARLPMPSGRQLGTRRGVMLSSTLLAG
jgi:hypothetical protein